MSDDYNKIWLRWAATTMSEEYSEWRLWVTTKLRDNYDQCQLRRMRTTINRQLRLITTTVGDNYGWRLRWVTTMITDDYIKRQLRWVTTMINDDYNDRQLQLHVERRLRRGTTTVHRQSQLLYRDWVRLCVVTDTHGRYRVVRRRPRALTRTRRVGR